MVLFLPNDDIYGRRASKYEVNSKCRRISLECRRISLEFKMETTGRQTPSE